MKRVFITGSTGFVGSHLIDFLLAKGEFDIHGTYRSEMPQETEHLHFYQVDLQKKEEVEQALRKVEPDWIFHLAAQSHVGKSFKDPLGTITNNLAGELNVLEAVKNLQKKDVRVLAVSTAEVYGFIQPEDLPIDESTPHRPGNPYAVSKIAQDYLALQYYLSYNIDIVRARPFSHIGPRQSDAFVVGKFAKAIAEIEKGKKEPVLKVGNMEAKRDFTDVRDMVRAYYLLMEKGEAGEAYNIGSGTSHKIADILSLLLSFSKVELTTEDDPALLRPSDIPDLYVNREKITSLTGWEPEISLEETLKDTLEYWRGVV